MSVTSNFNLFHLNTDEFVYKSKVRPIQDDSYILDLFPKIVSNLAIFSRSQDNIHVVPKLKTTPEQIKLKTIFSFLRTYSKYCNS